MMRRLMCATWIAMGLLLFAYRSPAPLVYTPGEGWTYVKPGETASWQRTRAKDQLEVAQKAFEDENYDLTLKAARRTVSRWPLSDYAPQAQYLVGRALEETGQDEKAFKQYQTLIEKYPRSGNVNEVLQRQYGIANRYLGGQWFKLWGYIPLPPDMDKTATMYEKIVQNGPYSEVGPKAQLSIGTALEKKDDFPKAVKAYERAADRYAYLPDVSSEALYRAGLAYQKEAKTSEYDQTVASKAIATFSDFQTLHPNDKRVTDSAQRIEGLRTEQARGSFETARFYEKRKKWEAAKIYYNDVLLKDPSSSYAEEARVRIAEIKAETGTSDVKPAAPPKSQQPASTPPSETLQTPK